MCSILMEYGCPGLKKPSKHLKLIDLKLEPVIFQLIKLQHVCVYEDHSNDVDVGRYKKM